MIVSLIVCDWDFIGRDYFLDCGNLIGTVMDVIISLIMAI
jgi:hypothetical protein